ncbi:unnamed protein product [Amoebophrya sp. A120]|nr:unnamed protein product [Amoebophrya sp. A120]|eukprot:GSA120T00018116001.1
MPPKTSISSLLYSHQLQMNKYKMSRSSSLWWGNIKLFPPMCIYFLALLVSDAYFSPVSRTTGWSSEGNCAGPSCKMKGTHSVSATTFLFARAAVLRGTTTTGAVLLEGSTRNNRDADRGTLTDTTASSSTAQIRAFPHLVVDEDPTRNKRTASSTRLVGATRLDRRSSSSRAGGASESTSSFPVLLINKSKEDNKQSPLMVDDEDVDHMIVTGKQKEKQAWSSSAFLTKKAKSRTAVGANANENHLRVLGRTGGDHADHDVDDAEVQLERPSYSLALSAVAEFGHFTDTDDCFYPCGEKMSPSASFQNLTTSLATSLMRSPKRLLT